MFTETLYQLYEMFPSTPKSIILKTDVINRGLKLNIDVVELLGHFRNFFALKDGTTIFVVFQRESPYTVNKKEDGYFLCYENEPIEEVFFTKVPNHLKKVNSHKNPHQYLMRSDKCAYIYPISACAYFFRNEECRYCGFNNTWDKLNEGNTDIIQDPSSCVEVVNDAIEEIGLEHVKLTGGSLYDIKKEADVYVSFARALREGTNIKEIYAYPQAFEKEDSKRLLDAGVDAVCYDIEVWDKKLWNSILPGKAKNVGRDEWLRRLIDAVDVFGEGRVATSIVAGYELAHPDGFDSHNQALESNVKGFEWLIKNGIEPLFFPWTPEMPGAKRNHGRNIINLKTTFVPTSYYLNLGLELHKLFMQYNMYEKLGHEKLGENPKNNRLVCYKCGYHSISQDYPRLITD